MKYLHEFQNNNEYNTFITDGKYIEPYVDWIVDQDSVNYNRGNVYSQMPLTFRILSDGDIYWNSGSGKNNYAITISYNKNNSGWVSITSTLNNTKIPVVKGDVVQFKGENSAYYVGDDYQWASFAHSTCDFNIVGNILSLISPWSYTTLNSISAKAFYRLFEYTNVINTEKLILPNFTANYCYSYMFYHCPKLTSTPTLPATTLSEGCYGAMFRDCTSLTTAPELPATTLASRCYQFMFDGCVKLYNVPELPATNLASYCYAYMFRACSITNAPALPATTLAKSCYSYMFSSCGNLLQSPILPAQNLVENCYGNMFNGCQKLSHVTAYFKTSVQDTTYTYNWLYQVSSTGTFTRNMDSGSCNFGTMGIPTGWTVQFEDGTLLWSGKSASSSSSCQIGFTKRYNKVHVISQDYDYNTYISESSDYDAQGDISTTEYSLGTWYWEKIIRRATGGGSSASYSCGWNLHEGENLKVYIKN